MTDIIDPKEKLLIECCISSIEVFVKVISILKDEYFDSPLDRVVRFIIKYYHKYKQIPSTTVIKAETGVELIHRDMEVDDIAYAIDEIESHCRNAAMRITILDSAKKVNQYADDEDKIDSIYGEIFESVRDVLTISVDKDLGLNQFEDVDMRHQRMQLNIDSRSIGWPSLDNLIDEVRRGEMVIFAGGTGAGKSVTLTNVANNMAKQNLSVLYISLELNEDLISKRMDSIITSIPVKSIFDNTENIQQIYQTQEYGSIYVKRMRGNTTANDIRAYLLEYSLQFKQYPDVICLDYIDLMSPINKAHMKDVFGKDKAVSEEFRDILDEYGIYGFSASQLNRDSIDQAIKSQSHIAGGISKLNTADAAIAISRTEEQIDTGEIEFQALKLRNSSMGKASVVLYWNDENLQITEQPNLKCKSLQKSDNHVEGQQEKLTEKDKIKELINRKKKKR